MPSRRTTFLLLTLLVAPITAADEYPNLLTEDDFSSLAATRINWRVPADTALELNLVQLDGDQKLSFPVFRRQEAAGGFGPWGTSGPVGPQLNSSPLICLEPPGPGGGLPGGDDDLLPAGFFRFDLVLDGLGLPEAKLVLLRLRPAGVELQLQFVGGGFQMRAMAGSDFTAWQTLAEGELYRVEVEFSAAPGSGSLDLRWIEDPGGPNPITRSQDLSGLDAQGWNALDLGAFDVFLQNGGLEPQDETGWIYLDDVGAYRHVLPPAD